MNTKILVSLLVAGWLFGAACNQQSGNSTAKKPDQASELVLSTRTFAGDIHDKDNWCNAHYPEAVIVFPTPDNNLRRYFDISDGVYRVAIEFGKITSSFFLQKSAKGPIQIFTSNNLPLCASNNANFSLRPDGFHYDNKHYVDYDVSLAPNGNNFRVYVDFPLGKQYGIIVNKCEDCK